ncbi:MAG TPA: ABC transporter ATP-binding protein [Candidatus Limnocylindria bacterium]
MNAAPAIETRGLVKHYRRGPTLVRAVDGLDVRIERGEFVAVVGRSGSGKTTLLDCLGLLLTPTGGQVLLEGAETSRLGGNARAALRAKRIGFVFQEFNLLPGLTALENVLLPLRYAGGNGEGRRRGETLLEEVGLGGRVSHRPSELSGGEQQRVAIARSLVNDPAIVLADEPTGELDTDTADELVALMRRVNRERGATFVVVTHDADLAARADRVIRLQDGRVAAT